MSKIDVIEPTQLVLGDKAFKESKPIGVYGILPPEWDTVFGVATAFWLLVVFIALIF